MKKFSLFLSALFISVMSFAADATFVFNTEAGLTALGIELPVTDAGNGAFQTALDDAAVYTMDGVGMSVTHKADGSENGKTRIWKKANGALDLRAYKDGGSLTFTAPEGGTISKIVLDGGKINFTVDGVALTDKTWAGEAASVTLVVTATCNVNTITVTYEAAAVEEPAEKPVVTAAELEQINGEEEIFHFYLSQGVAVDKNPESPYYGYTYVTAATDGDASDAGSEYTANQKRGIFVFDAELNSLNPDNVGFLPANAAALMTDVSRQAMHRLAVNPVNNHVAFCYNVEGASAIWSMDPANLTGDAVNLIEGLAITKANAFCFDAEGTLYVMDNANTADGGKIVKVVNGELVTIAQSGIWGVQDISLVSDGRGGLWIAQNRWAVDAYAVLSHVNAAGEIDFKVTGDSPEEVKALFPYDSNASYRGQCGYNVKNDVLAFGGNKVVTLFHVTYDAAGVPSIAKIGATPVVGSNIDGVDFYANGDLAVVSASAERFQKYAVTYTVEGGEEEPEIEYIEMALNITNTVFDAETMAFTGSNADYAIEVSLIPDMEKPIEGEEMTFGLAAASTITREGNPMEIIEGQIAVVDVETASANAIVAVKYGEDYYRYIITMTQATAETIEIELVGPAITVAHEDNILSFTSTWTYNEVEYPFNVKLNGVETLETKNYAAPQVAELQIGGDGDDDPWLDWAVANEAQVVVEEGTIMFYASFTSFASGTNYVVTIATSLPQPEPEKPEPTYTDNNLNPYAFGLESELSDDQATLTVTYRLNNSKATSVNVVIYNGEDIVASIPGTTTIGKNTVEVATADLPAGVELKWAVEVNGTSVEAPTQESKIYSFYHPSGLDIDNNPENPTFGMLLINEGMQKVKGVDGYVSTGFGAGIFAFTPSFDLLPNGDQPGYNGGIEFTEGRADAAGSTAYSPRRIRISEDGRIFVTSLNTDGNYLWEVNADNLNEWTSVFKGTLNDQRELITEDSAFIAAPNVGFDVKGAGENLQLAMYSANLAGIGTAMNGFRLHEYNLGTATEWTTAPSKAIVEGKYAINYTGTQVEYDNEGGLWIASYRGTASDANPGLVHINADGVEDAKLIWNNVRQAGIRFNNDFTKLVVAGNNGAAKKATIYAVSKDENGAPVLTEETVIDMAAVGNNLNDFAFDYAGNLYACGNSAEKLIGWAMPYSGQVVTPAASKYAFKLAAPVEIVGVVKRALQNGENTIVLTHEADGTAHIYNVVDGVITEVSQEGVIARDPENAGDLLAISDIAVTEDGKLVATNYMITQSADDQVVAGDKRGETRIYIWNDLAGDPAILFTSKMSSNWFQSKQGLTMAVKGTSDNMEIFMTGIHKSKAWARVSSYRVIDGVYTEPEVNNNDYYHFYDINDAIALETTVGTQYELNASPLGAMNWILDAELINPVEIVEPETNNVEISSCVALSTDLGKKYNGATILSSEDATVMVAPYADADGKLAGVKILDITNGLAAAEELQVLALEAPVEATAAATAVEIPEDEDAMYIYLVADATIYTLKAVAEEEEEIDMTIENATASLEGQNIMLNGMWGESNVTISLWQGGATQGYGIYSGEGEGDYYGMVTNPFMQLMPSGDGVYTDNGNGTWTFKAFMTDGSLYYNVTMNGLTSGGGVEIADYITIDNTNIMKEGVMTNFVGYNDYYEVDLILFGQEYGEYKAVEEDGETIYPIEGFINEVAFVGEGVYSFSDEYNSDLLVATIYVPADGIYYEVTMYTKQVVATDVLIMENMTKEIIEGRWNTNLQLSGTHDTYGEVVITIAGCDGTYGEYAVTATVGDLELEGYGAWQNDGDVDVLNAMLQNADASRVFNVSVSTPYVEDPEPEIIGVEIENAIFTETEDGLEITGTSLEGQELYLLVGEWATVGYDMYTEFGAVVGTIDGVEVTIMGEDQYAAIEKDEDRAILAAVLTDGTNIYEISAYGAAPGTGTGVGNISTADAPVKVIENGKLVIIKNGIKYDAQGAVIK